MCMAKTVEKGIGKHGMEKTLLSMGLGCQVKYTKDYVYADSLNLNDKKTETPIGVNCRTCDRMDCQQRAFPPLHKKFDIELNKILIAAFNQRRKKIINSLNGLLTIDQIKKANINPESRPENLTVDDFLSLSKARNN